MPKLTLSIIPKWPTYWLVLLTLLLTGCATTSNKSNTSKTKPIIAKKEEPIVRVAADIIFIAYTVDEYLTFKALLPYLRGRQILAKILVFGPALQYTSEHADVNATNLITLLPQSVQNNPEVLEKFQNSNRITLNNVIIDFMIKSTASAIMVTGISHAAQAQMTYFAYERGIYTVAFYDSFLTPDTNVKAQDWLQSKSNLKEIFLVGDYLIPSFEETFTNANITVTGNPAWTHWENHQSINKSNVLSTLKLNNTQKIVLFSADNDLHFKPSLMDWIAVMKNQEYWQGVIKLPADISQPLKEKVLQKIAQLPHIVVAPDQLEEVTLVNIADLIVTHQSIIGMKAAYLNKPVIYFTDKQYKNILIDYGLAQLAPTRAFLSNKMHVILDRPYSIPPTWENVGIPDNAIVTFGNRLSEINKKYKSGMSLPALKNLKLE